MWVMAKHSSLQTLVQLKDRQQLADYHGKLKPNSQEWFYAGDMLRNSVSNVRLMLYTVHWPSYVHSTVILLFCSITKSSYHSVVGHFILFSFAEHKMEELKPQDQQVIVMPYG